MTYAPAALLGAILARVSASTPPVTLAQIADGHGPQLELMTRACEKATDGGFLHRNIIALCSRRAGKSNGIMGLLATDASEYDGVQIYFGKTKPAVRLSIWHKIWKPFCKKHGLSVVHNETSMVSTFSSGGIVAFTGTDDVAHVESYLGNKLRRAVIDEAQAQNPSVLDPLVDRILPPALSDTGGQLILAGTIPEVPAGTFYDLWQMGEGWLKRNWSRFDNPHMVTPEQRKKDPGLTVVEHQMKRLAEFMKTSGRKIDDPLVRRDWFGEFVFDVSATAYSYFADRNQYKPVEPLGLGKFLAKHMGDPVFSHVHRTLVPDDGTCRNGVMAAIPFKGIEVYSCAIDPGAARDRFSIQVFGWGSGTPKVQQVFEFSSARKANLSWGQIAPMIAWVQSTYGPAWWYYDAGGSKVVLDSFVGDTGLPALQPATKSGLKGQVDRVSDLLLKGWIQVMAGSALEEDYQKSRWDPDARAKHIWKYASQWHPDPAEAGRYALAPFIEVYEPEEEEKTPEDLDREKQQLAVRRRQAAKLGHVLDEDMDAAVAADEEVEEAYPWD